MLTMPWALEAQLPYIPPDHKGQAISSSIAFFPNQGQVATTDHDPAEDVLYVSFGHPVRLYIREESTVSFVLPVVHPDSIGPDTLYRVDMQFTGESVNWNTTPEPAEMVSYHHNYYLPTCISGLTNVPGFGRVIYPEIYPGIDVHLYSNPFGYKIYLVINPGADPADILLEFSGQDSLNIDWQGALRMYLNERYLRLPHAIAYQDINGQTVQVPWWLQYQEVDQDHLVNFVFDNYDPSYPLIVDISGSIGPQPGPMPSSFPEWSTYYGGNVDEWMHKTVATTTGGVAGCGVTTSFDFPVSNISSITGNQDGFVSYFNDQYQRVFTTFYGGDYWDEFTAVAEYSGGLVLAGTTGSNAFTMNYSGPPGAFVDNTTIYGAVTPILVAMDFTGDVNWSTSFGLSSDMRPVNIGVDKDDNIVVGGTTQHFIPWVLPYVTQLTCGPTVDTHPICGSGYMQDEFTYTLGTTPYLPSWTKGWIAKFNASFELTWSTLFGGSSTHDVITDIAVDKISKEVFITGFTNSPMGTNPSCAPPVVQQPGFPWCEFPNGYYQQVPGPQNSHLSLDLSTCFIASFDQNNELSWCTAFGEEDVYSEGTALHAVAGQLVLAGVTDSYAYSSVQCSAPNVGFPSCTTSMNYTYLPTSTMDTEGFAAELRSFTKELQWSTLLGQFQPRDITTDPTVTNKYLAGVSYNPSQVLMDNPLYYSDTDPNSPGEGYIIGLAPNGLFWATRWGGNGLDQLNNIQADPNPSRVYVGGRTSSTSYFPYNCPPTAQPWCVPTNAGASDLFYGQLKLDVLQVGTGEEMAPSEMELLLYPDPTADMVTVQCNGEGCGVLSRIQIYNTLGQLVLEDQRSPSTAPWTLSVAALAKGQYHVIATDVEGAMRLRRSFLIVSP